MMEDTLHMPDEILKKEEMRCLRKQCVSSFFATMESSRSVLSIVWLLECQVSEDSALRRQTSTISYSLVPSPSFSACSMATIQSVSGLTLWKWSPSWICW